MKILIHFLFLGLVSARPSFGNNKPLFAEDTLDDLLREAQDDITDAIMSKSGALSFMGETMVNLTLDSSTLIGDLTLNASNLVNEYVDQIGLDQIDFEASLNDTEESIKEKKKVVVEALFDSKREILKLFGLIGNAEANFNATENQDPGYLIGLYDDAIAQIVITKNITANAIAELTIDNIVLGFQNATNATSVAINDAITSSLNSLQNTSQNLIYSMLGAKQQLHEFLENFNSQQALHDQTINVALTLNATLAGTENAAANWGVFAAMDNIVHSIGQVPNKINSFLKQWWNEKIPSDVEQPEKENVEEPEKDVEEVMKEDDVEDIDVERPKRDLASIEDMTIEQLDAVLQSEMKFWNILSQALSRQMRKLE